MRRPLTLYPALGLALVLAVVAAPDPVRLVRELGDPSACRRDAAARELASMGSAALPALTAGAESDDAAVRTRAASLLALARDEAGLRARAVRAAEAVAAALRAPQRLDEGSEFDAAIRDLAPESSRFLAQAVRRRTADGVIDRRVACALVRHAVPESVELLAELVRDERLLPSSGLAAARELDRLAESDLDRVAALRASCDSALAALREAMRSRHDATRRAAVAVFGVLAPAADVAVLPAAGDRCGGVRAEAARVMGAHAPSQSAASLRRLARDADAGVREAALLALCRVPGTPDPAAAVAASADPSAAVRAAAARLLGREATPEAIPVLEELALDGSVRVRAAARRALSSLRG